MMNGVEVQLQVGPLRFWRGEIEKGHPVLIEMFATGELVFDRTGEATALKRDAEAIFQAGPRAPAPQYFEQLRYTITNLVRDLEDMSEDSVEARMLADVLVLEALRFWGANQLLWPNRKPYVMLRRLQERNPSLAAKIERFYASFSPAHAIAFTDAVLEPAGGRIYEFATDPEPA
jgi:hypothetical protein